MNNKTVQTDTDSLNNASNTKYYIVPRIWHLQLFLTKSEFPVITLIRYFSNFKQLVYNTANHRNFTFLALKIPNFFIPFLEMNSPFSLLYRTKKNL